MSVRTETLQLRVVVDGTPARKELAGLDQEYAKLNSEIKGLKTGTQEYIAAAARMEVIKGRQAELRKEIGDTALTAKQLTDELKRLQVAQRNTTPNTAQWTDNANRIEVVKNRLKELNDVNVRTAAAWEVQRKSIAMVNMTMEQLEMESRRLGAALRTMDPNSREFVNLRRELNAVDGRMQQLRTGLGPFGRAWAEVKTQVMGAGAVLGAFLAGGAILQAFKGWVNGAAELSDAQADVQRTTGLTKVEVDELTRSLGQMNTRTARAELLALAADAGKLGITAKEDVLQFVRAGDQIRVALGEDLGEDAIKNIGKLNQTFQVGRATGKDLEGQMLATGSAINALGQSSTAQESYLVDFATRMAGVNTQANINIQSTLGYAATLDQLGQRSETASTALSQFTLKAFQNTAEYAKIAGMGLEDFTSLLNTDTNEALLRVLQGLKGNNEGLSRMTGLFGDLGQEGARAVSVLASLANNTDLVRQQQAIANKEFAAATSITNEFNAKNSTLAANLDIIGKRLAGAFVNSGVVSAINSIVKGMAAWLKLPVDSELQKQRVSVNALVFETMRLKEGDEKRIANIQQLKKEHPQHFANLKAETATNGELAAAMEKVNAAYVKKILLVRAQDDIADIQDRQAEAFEDEGEALDRVNQVRSSAMLQMTADQKQRFTESYDLIKGHFQKVQQVESSEVARNIRFNTWMQKNGMPATLYDEVRKLVNTDAEYEAALQRRLTIDEEFQQKMDRINRLASMVDSDDGLAPEVETAGGGGTGGAEQDKAAVARMDELRNELRDMREAIFQDGLSADEREIRQMDVQHAREMAKLRANTQASGADIAALEEKQAKDRAALIEGQGEERAGKYSEAAERIRRSMLSAVETELEDEIKKWDDLIALGKKYEIDVSELEERKGKALEAIRKKWRDKAQEEDDDATAKALAVYKKQLEERIRLLNSFATLAGSVASLIDAVKTVEEQRADADGVRTAEEMKRIDALEQRRRVAALVQIAVSSASGVAQAIQAGAGIPFPGNLFAIAAGVAAVLSGIGQAYALLNQASTSSANNTQSNSSGSNLQNVPLGEKGGIFDGPPHSRGGLKVYDPEQQRVVAEVEGGEPWMVLSKEFRRKNSDLIPRLLQASASGKRLDMVQGGSVFSEPRSFNFAKASEAISMAGGGVVGSRRQITRGTALVNMPTNNSGGPGMAEMMKMMSSMVAMQQRTAEALANMPTSLDARVSLRDLQRRTVEDEKYRKKGKVQR